MDATLPNQDTRPKARVSSGSGGDVMLPTPTPTQNPTESKSDHPISSDTAADANSMGDIPSPGELVSQQATNSSFSSSQQESQAAPTPDPQGPPPLPMFPDPRASSTQSLLSSTDGEEECKKRKLLVIYIHGYMGSDSSFQSFPAHVHNLLKNLLAESHIVHTKIYPRYKTYRSLELARDNFSDWLIPYESPTTDVVLVGHSMGGLLAAEVAMMPSIQTATSPFRHRILGIVCLDAPLLGLHPGIVVSGIASLFRPSPESFPADDNSIPTEHKLSEPSQSLSHDPSICCEPSSALGASSPAMRSEPWPSTTHEAFDPYFNPPFFNDVEYKDRGRLKNFVHFINKYKEENLIQAAASHLVSHLEFNACLADLSGLRARYHRLRSLEDIDVCSQTQNPVDKRPGRVRFINYYTVCPGLPKKQETSLPDTSEVLWAQEAQLQNVGSGTLSLNTGSGTSTPKISIENHSTDQRHSTTHTSNLKLDSGGSVLSTTCLPPTNEDKTHNGPSFPPPPLHPHAVDSASEASVRKRASRLFKRAQKALLQAIEDGNNTTTPKAHQEHRFRDVLRDIANQVLDRDTDIKSHNTHNKHDALSESASSSHVSLVAEREAEDETISIVELTTTPTTPRKRLRKFCLLPTKINGEPDQTWIEVYIADVDEVGAHCSMFDARRPHYEQLAGDVGQRIAQWVWDDASARAVLDSLSNGCLDGGYGTAAAAAATATKEEGQKSGDVGNKQWEIEGCEEKREKGRETEKKQEVEKDEGNELKEG